MDGKDSQKSHNWLEWCHSKAQPPAMQGGCNINLQCKTTAVWYEDRLIPGYMGSAAGYPDGCLGSRSKNLRTPQSLYMGWWSRQQCQGENIPGLWFIWSISGQVWRMVDKDEVLAQLSHKTVYREGWSWEWNSCSKALDACGPLTSKRV